MKKRILTIICCLVFLLALAVPSFALSYDGNEYPQTPFYSLIPWDEIAYTENGSTWRFAPYGSTYYRTNVQHGQDRDPAYAETEQYVVGWTYDDGEEPTVEYLTVYANQTYYSQPSIYYANYVNYQLESSSGNGTGVKLQFTCRNVHLTQTQWNALYNYAWVKATGNSIFDLSVNIAFVGVDTEQNELASRSLYFERQALTGGGSQWKYLPDWSALTAKGLDTYSNGYMIKQITLTLEFDTLPTTFSIGNLYYNATVLEPDIPVFEKEVVTEKEIIVEVPEEELDLFSWIINPIEKFLNVEFFPGISIGGIFGIFVMIFVAIALIKIWGT